MYTIAGCSFAGLLWVLLHKGCVVVQPRATITIVAGEETFCFLSKRAGLGHLLRILQQERQRGIQGVLDVQLAEVGLV